MREEESQFSISGDIQKGVNEAFSLAVEWLNASGPFAFLYFSNGGQRQLAVVDGCKDQLEVLEKIRKWGRSNMDAEWFVQMSCAKKEEGSQNIDLLVAHCVERNQKEGFVLAQSLANNPTSNKIEPIGQIDFMKRIPNDYFENS